MLRINRRSLAIHREGVRRQVPRPHRYIVYVIRPLVKTYRPRQLPCLKSVGKAVVAHEGEGLFDELGPVAFRGAEPGIDFLRVCLFSLKVQPLSETPRTTCGLPSLRVVKTSRFSPPPRAWDQWRSYLGRYKRRRLPKTSNRG
jgi:hypothetical protein